MKTAGRAWCYLVVGASLFAASPALAQATGSPPSGSSAASQSAPLTGLWFTTPYPDFTLSAGETGSFPLTLRNAGLPPQRTDIEVKGLPTGWQAKLTGGGHPVTAAIVGDNDTQDLTLDVTPPTALSSGTFKFEVDAHYPGGTASLPLSLTLSAQKPGGIKLAPELPALRGTPSTTFKYQVKISNDTSKDELFNLAADAPDGFETSFTHGYDSAEITGVPITAGNSDTVTMTVKPNAGVAAGTYPLALKVLAGSLSASTDLTLQVTGSPALSLTGPDQRLSGEAVAGQSASFPFTLENTGSAPAQDIKLSSAAPTDWNVTFEPSTLPSLAPGASQQVKVKIQPSDKAIAGDYVVNLDANAGGTSQSAQFRVTVNASTWWGIVGLVIIAIAAIILVLAVLRYGRR